eukprot:gene23136-9475_t
MFIGYQSPYRYQSMGAEALVSKNQRDVLKAWVLVFLCV